MEWKERGRILSYPFGKHCTGNCLIEWHKQQNSSIGTVGLCATARNTHNVGMQSHTFVTATVDSVTGTEYTYGCINLLAPEFFF